MHEANVKYNKAPVSDAKNFFIYCTVLTEEFDKHYVGMASIFNFVCLSVCRPVPLIQKYEKVGIFASATLLLKGSWSKKWGVPMA